ncbi:IS4 family transposase [candidate division KSB1 bacterium]|nr:IS4 family transposase [candidate division KSB1 bacterium]
MNSGKLVFSQLTSYLPMKAFRRCVARYRGSYKVQSFSCWDQYLCMAFAQLTYRESLRDIEVCLRAMQGKLYHMGIRGNVSKSTLADANENRDWRIYADFAQILIHHARSLYIDEDFGVELEQTVYALDSTTIDLCLSVFQWALFRKNKGAVKLHTLLDLRGPIPAFVWITDGTVHDVNILDELIPEAGSIYLFDRAYIDYKRLLKLHNSNAFFITRAKSNLRFKRQYSYTIDKSTGLKCDQIGILEGFYSSKNYPEKIRRIKYYDDVHDKNLVFLTNNLTLPALTISQLYKCRWKVETFFKWIKQHLRIKSFYGTSENAVKTQIWIAISIYILVAIVKKQLKLEISLYTFLQILSLTMFEKDDIFQLVKEGDYNTPADLDSNQLNLFDL